MWSHYQGRQKTYMGWRVEGVGRHRKVALTLSVAFLSHSSPWTCPKACPKGQKNLSGASPKQAAHCCLHHCPPVFGFTLSNSLPPFLWEAPGLTAKSQKSGGWLCAGDGMSSCTSRSTPRSSPVVQQFSGGSTSRFPSVSPWIKCMLSTPYTAKWKFERWSRVLTQQFRFFSFVLGPFPNFCFHSTPLRHTDI